MSNSIFDNVVGGAVSEIKVVVAGALGGVVRWRALHESPIQGISSVIIGAISAIYLGPIIVPFFQLFISNFIVDPVSQQTFAGFVIGLTGTTLVGFVIDVVKGAIRKGKKIGGNSNDNDPPNKTPISAPEPHKES